MTEGAGSWEAQIEKARAGSLETLGRLLDLARPYLLLIANQELPVEIRAKVAGSDLVQEAMLEAHRIFARFEGATQQELLAWLRGVLLNKLSEQTRHYRGTQKRQVGREIPLPADASGSQILERPLPGDEPTPSSIASDREEAERVRHAIDRLPEHYQQVIRWREWEELPFEEIARRLGKSVDATRMLWWRALEKLQQELDPAEPA